MWNFVKRLFGFYSPEPSETAPGDTVTKEVFLVCLRDAGRILGVEDTIEGAHALSLSFIEPVIVRRAKLVLTPRMVKRIISYTEVSDDSPASA